MRPACERPIPAGGGEERARVHHPVLRESCIRGRFTVDIIFVRLLFVIVVAVTCFVIGPFGLSPSSRRRCRRSYRRRDRPVRMEAAHRQPQAADRRGDRQHPRNLRRLPVRAGHPQQRSRGTHPELPADPGHAADGLRRPDRRGQQGRSAQPGGAGRRSSAARSRARRATRFSTPASSSTGALPTLPRPASSTASSSPRSSCCASCNWSPTRPTRSSAIADAAVSTSCSGCRRCANLQIQIVEDDFPAVREVDLKLIELAKVYEGKIITNDFNLNKVAQLAGR